MKRILLIILPLIALTAGLTSCSEDFKVDAPYKPVTVVYGLLNTDSARNYIRIQKAFLDENKSALDMAQVSDSNYFSSLDVHLKELNNGAVIHDEILQLVDLAQEGYPKQPGAFFNSPNNAYKSSRKPTPGYRYRLVIYNSGTGERDSAETPALSDYGFPGFVATRLISFTDEPSSAHYDYKVNFNPGDSAQYFEGVLRFHYVSKNVSTGVQTDSSFDWVFATERRDPATLTVPQASFYPTFAGNIHPAPANIERYIDSCDLFLYAASQDYYTYYLASTAQGGITGDQIRPSYTNIRGAGVLGLFASRGITMLRNVPIDNPSIQALMTNGYTNNLNIRGRSDH